MSRKKRELFNKSLERASAANIPLDQRNQSYFNIKILSARKAKWWAEVLEMPNDIRDELAKDFEEIATKSFAKGVDAKQERARETDMVKGKLLKNCFLLTQSLRGKTSKRSDKYAASAITKIIETVEEIQAMQIMDVIEEGFER